MNIKDVIKKWAESYKWEACYTEEKRKELDDDLEMVLFAIETLKEGKS